LFTANQVKDLGDVAAVVRSSTISPLNNRTTKETKNEAKNNRAATYSGLMKIQAFERCYTIEGF